MARSRDGPSSTAALFVTIATVLLVVGALGFLFAPELTADDRSLESDTNGTAATPTPNESAPTTPSGPTAEADGSSDGDPDGDDRPAVDSDRDGAGDAVDDGDDSDDSLFERLLEGTDTTDESTDSDDRDRDRSEESDPPVAPGQLAH
mgnify:FL=1